MAVRNRALVVVFTAIDITTGARKTGDQANITPRWIKDGVIAALTTATVTQVDATNAPGAYKVSLDADECDCAGGMLTGKSGTANVEIVPTFITFEEAAAGGGGSGPSAADILAAFKADEEWQVILANVNGENVFNPDTGVLILKDKAGAVTLATLTLTRDGDGVITARASV